MKSRKGCAAILTTAIAILLTLFIGLPEALVIVVPAIIVTCVVMSLIG